MTLNHAITRTLLLLGTLALFAGTVSAQTTINNTTLSAAITTTSATTASVAAVTCTGCTVGVDTLLFVDAEAMRVTAVNGLVLRVSRGSDGTQAATHANAATVFLGPGLRFHGASGSTLNGDPSGSCTRTNQAFTPWINISNGNIWSCWGSAWVGANSKRITYGSTPTS